MRQALAGQLIGLLGMGSIPSLVLEVDGFWLCE